MVEEGKRANDHVVCHSIILGVPQQSEIKCVSTHLAVIKNVLVIAMKNLIQPCLVVSWVSNGVSSFNCCCNYISDVSLMFTKYCNQFYFSINCNAHYKNHLKVMHKHVYRVTVTKFIQTSMYVPTFTTRIWYAVKFLPIFQFAAI